MLAGLRAELLRPEPVQAIADMLAAEVNQVLDQRPALQLRAASALDEAERRLANLVQAIEGGAAARPLLEAIPA